MQITNEEKNLLSKLASGALDGTVGSVLECGGYKKVYVGKYIKNGVPVSYREGEDSKFFNGKENEFVSGEREEEYFDTDEKKLSFLKRFGWLIDDEDARNYSVNFKGRAS